MKKKNRKRDLRKKEGMNEKKKERPTGKDKE
mgnify:CR=1 FL=1